MKGIAFGEKSSITKPYQNGRKQRIPQILQLQQWPVIAFATVAGSAMPGGLGVADGALIGGAKELIVGITVEQAMLASILTRIATMWFGVALGALALLKLSSILGGPIEIEKSDD